MNLLVQMFDIVIEVHFALSQIRVKTFTSSDENRRGEVTQI